MVKKRRKRQARAKELEINCEQATELIMDYLSGELDRETTQAFERHLLECPDCVSFLTTYKETIRAARSLRYEDIPAAMQKRIDEFLKEKINKVRPKSKIF